jgi:glycerol-3-phosphate dehydrogenase (NAD(P)+)
MASRHTIAVLGAGNMGTALGQVMASNGHDVRLWSIEHDVLEEIRDQHRNTKYLDEIELHPSISAVWEMAEAIDGAVMVVVSVPSQVVGPLGRDLGPHLESDQAILNVAKGLEADTHRRMSETLTAALGPDYKGPVGSLAGPAIAMEMARGQPVAVIAGMPDPASASLVQSILQNENLKVEMTTDVAGMEYCAVLKNVYAIGLGICDGMELGMNAKAFVVTVALGEMSRIVESLGGRPETVQGLAGLGDLITTGFSPHSRNRTLGEKLATGGAEEFLGKNTVEGVSGCRAVTEIVDRSVLGLRLLETIHEVVCEGRPGPEMMRGFVARFSYG